MAGALVRPNGITTYSNKPIGVKKAVLCSCPSFMCTWWYAEVLLMSRRSHIFIHQIDRVIQRSMWGKSRCLKNILKFVAKSSKTRVNLFFPLRLFLPITWSNKSYPEGCIGLGFQSCKPVLSRNQFGTN